METLMEHLPPSGWADVARKDDILKLEAGISSVEERLEMKIDIRVEQLRSEMYKGFGDIAKAMNRQLITFTSVQFALMSILAGVILKFG